MSRAKRGFTLIELLVVIAIIAILAAILFPVFAQAREKARAITCLSNMKEIGTAILMYNQDYDECMPAWIYPGTGLPNPISYDVRRLWVSKLQPYVKSGGQQGGPNPPTNTLFACPSWSKDKLFAGADKPECDGNGTYGSGLGAYFNPALYIFATYGYPWFSATIVNYPGCTTPATPCFHYPGSSGTGAGVVALAQVVKPAETACVTDGVTMGGGGYFLITFGCESSEMHQGGGNLTFMDGHSKHLARNPERYVAQKSNDIYFYERYFTYEWE